MTDTRLKHRSKPSGWGMYSPEGKLLAYHTSEVVVRRWAENRPGNLEVERIADREARLRKEEAK